MTPMLVLRRESSIAVMITQPGSGSDRCFHAPWSSPWSSPWCCLAVKITVHEIGRESSHSYASWSSLSPWAGSVGRWRSRWRSRCRGTRPSMPVCAPAW